MPEDRLAPHIQAVQQSIVSWAVRFIAPKHSTSALGQGGAPEPIRPPQSVIHIEWRLGPRRALVSLTEDSDRSRRPPCCSNPLATEGSGEGTRLLRNLSSQ